MARWCSGPDGAHPKSATSTIGGGHVIGFVASRRSQGELCRWAGVRTALGWVEVWRRPTNPLRLLRREHHSRRVSRRLGPGACALAGVGRKGPAVGVSPEAWPGVQQNAPNGLIQLNLARVAFRSPLSIGAACRLPAKRRGWSPYEAEEFSTGSSGRRGPNKPARSRARRLTRTDPLGR